MTLQDVIDSNGDPSVMLVYADYLTEASPTEDDENMALALRWMAVNEKWPVRCNDTFWQWYGPSCWTYSDRHRLPWGLHVELFGPKESSYDSYGVDTLENILLRVAKGLKTIRGYHA